jgi:rhodanese-related sulfurtransferase
MPGLNSISCDKLFRLIGTPGAPIVIDIREGTSGRLVPASLLRPASSVEAWSAGFAGCSLVLIDDEGAGPAQGAAAWLRSAGAVAEALDGGFAGWLRAGLPVIATDRLPRRDAAGRTIWVTRARPKVDRIACPWLIRRFVDPRAVFLFVPPADVLATAERFDAAPFDIAGEGQFWSHRGENCTFDVMIEAFGLADFGPLAHLARIVRGADTDRLEIAPEAAGLLAASLGLSRMFPDDLDQLEAGLLLYDAFYRWCRDAVDETHDWVSHVPKLKAKA